MTDTTFRDCVIDALWPPGLPSGMSVWAIVDCARDERIYHALRNSRFVYFCLYSGRLPRELEVAAPHLVELTPEDRFTHQLIDMGWGNSWGVFLRIKDPSILRRHLRTFLRVQDESGRNLLFRYYDPRVLRIYLPTCQPEELRTVFGPICSYLTESEDGRSLMEFQFDGHRLTEHRTDLAT